MPALVFSCPGSATPTLVTDSLTYCQVRSWTPLKLETLQIFDQLDKQTKRQKIKGQKIKDKKTYTIFLIL